MLHSDAFSQPWGVEAKLHSVEGIGLASPRFDRLRAIVAVSSEVDLKTGGDLGALNETFDSLAGDQAILGKMALLNLYSVLTDEQDPIAHCPWFDHVTRIVPA